METAALVFFFVLGLLIHGASHIFIPSYLAVIVIKTLFPSFKDFALSDRWYEYVLAITLGISIALLLHSFGIDASLELPAWAPWVPERAHNLFHGIFFPLPIAMFAVKIICTLLWRRSPKKVQETEPRKAL